MISKKDSRPFLIKQAIGGKQTNKDDTIYESQWHTVYGLIGDPTGAIYARMYGIEEVYDKVIIVNATNLTSSIQNNTLIMIDNYPTSNYQYGDYDISRIYPPYNGEIVIGLTKRESIDMPKIYYDSKSDDILYYQLNFDKTKLKAYVSTKLTLPFKIDDYIWTREPSSNKTTSHLYTFKSKIQIGYDNRYKPFYELTFEEVEEQTQEVGVEENDSQE